jgi:hypothetical protein
MLKLPHLTPCSRYSFLHLLRFQLRTRLVNLQFSNVDILNLTCKPSNNSSSLSNLKSSKHHKGRYHSLNMSSLHNRCNRKYQLNSPIQEYQT